MCHCITSTLISQEVSCGLQQGAWQPGPFINCHWLPLAQPYALLLAHLPYDASALGDLGPPQLKAGLTGGQAFAHTVTQPGALPDVTQFRGKEAAQVAADKVGVTEADRQVSRGDQVVGGSYFNQAGF